MMTGWRNKLALLFKGPGWQPGKPRLGCNQDIPDVSADSKEAAYQADAAIHMQLYCALHFLLVLLFHVHLAQRIDRVTQFVVVLVFAFVFLSLTAFGALMEGKRWGARVELMRCLFFALLDDVLLPRAPASLANSAVRLLFFLSLLFWSISFLSDMRLLNKLTTRDVSSPVHSRQRPSSPRKERNIFNDEIHAFASER